jgi:small subunit ribosomal protein S15
LPKKVKGKSHSIRPVSKRAPTWCKYKPEEVDSLIIKLAKEGHNLSKIGTILRDQHGIPLTKPLTGKSVSQTLREAELEQPIPEDLETMLKKAARVNAHLEKNQSDLHNKRSLQIVEAKIYKLSRYYKRKGRLPPEWQYK